MRKIQPYHAFSGFSLLELVIAASIFAVAVCGVASLFVSLTALAKSAGNITRMTNLAREELENNVYTADFETLNSYHLLPPAVPAGTSLACYIQDHGSINNLKQAIIVVCYRQKSNMVMGEDKNLNGILDAGEDSNGDGRLSSLCEFAAFVTRKE